MKISGSENFINAYRERFLNRLLIAQDKSKNMIESKECQERNNQEIAKIMNSEEIKKIAEEKKGAVNVSLSEEGRNWLNSNHAEEEALIIKDIGNLYKDANRKFNKLFKTSDSNNVFAMQKEEDLIFMGQDKVFDEYFRNSGIYNQLTAEKADDVRNLLEKITRGMNSISDMGGISSSEAQLDLESSTAALRLLGEKLVNDPDKKAEFDQLVEQYHQYNSEVLPNYKSIGEKFAENLARVRSEKPYSLQAAKNIANEEALIFKYNPEEIKKNNQELALLFSKMNKENKEGIISQIKDNFLKFATNNSKNEEILFYAEDRSKNILQKMNSYWSDLLSLT